MRVLVATNELQGLEPDDYSFTVEGELVVVDVVECGAPGRCGCGRGFPGIASRRATTTAMVVELPHLTATDLHEVISDHVDALWADLLWSGPIGQQPDAEQAIAEVLRDITDEYVANVAQVGADFPPGTVVERSGSVVRARAVRRAA